MGLVYASVKVKTQCTSVKAAKKLFGGDTVLATSLLARINALEKADTIKDINPELHPGDEKPRLSLSFRAFNP